MAEENKNTEKQCDIHVVINWVACDWNDPSKSRLKKCEKGLHEFQETQFTTTENSIVKKQWFCKHCGNSMHNRG